VSFGLCAERFVVFRSGTPTRLKASRISR